jgi:hypothetical protein
MVEMWPIIVEARSTYNESNKNNFVVLPALDDVRALIVVFGPLNVLTQLVCS